MGVNMKMCETREPSNSIFYNMSHDFQQLNTFSEVWEVLRSGVRNFIDTHENIVGDFFKKKNFTWQHAFIAACLIECNFEMTKSSDKQLFSLLLRGGKKRLRTTICYQSNRL